MRRDLLALSSRHRVFAAYFASLLWLLLAAVTFRMQSGRGGANVALLAALIGGVALVYVAVWHGLEKVAPALHGSLSGGGEGGVSGWRYRLLLALVIAYTLVAAAHFALLGYVPILQAMSTESDVGVSLVRQRAYFELPLWMRYASDYSVKALGPALLLVTYYFRSRLFWAVLTVGVLYSVGLFARILPVIFLFPLLVYMLMRRRWVHLVLGGVLLGGSLVFVTAVSSVAIRESMVISTPQEPIQVDESVARNYENRVKAVEDDRDWRRTSVAYALFERALYVPGQVIDQWFFYYGDPQRWERGCAYRLLAPLLGCKYVPVPTKLYTAFYKENVAQGMQGSLNAASFMTEYANFGPLGLVLSSLLGGGLFAVVMAIYRDHPLALPMNLPLIVASMETSLLTAINSGAGWIVMTAVFIVFFRMRPAR